MLPPATTPKTLSAVINTNNPALLREVTRLASLNPPPIITQSDLLAYPTIPSPKSLVEPFEPVPSSIFSPNQLYAPTSSLDPSIDDDKITQYHEKIFGQNPFLKEQNIQTFLQVINKALSSAHSWHQLFSKLNLSHTITLAGGCLRDIMLSRSVKDIDIIICFHETLENYSNITIENIKSNLPELDEKMFPKNFADQDIFKKIKFLTQTLGYYLNPQDINNPVFTSSPKTSHTTSFGDYSLEPQSDGLDCLRVEEYVQLNSILNVIKTPPLDSDKAVDFIFSSMSIPKFIDDFDCAICKIGLNLVDYISKDNPKNKDMPTAKDVFSRLIVTREFLKDSATKTLTLNYQNHPKSSIEHSINLHLPRLLDKFSDYDAVLQSQAYLDLLDLNYKLKINAMLEEHLIKQGLGNNSLNTELKSKFKI